VRLRNSSRWCTSASLHAGHGHAPNKAGPASEARAVTVRSGDVLPGTTSTSMQGERPRLLAVMTNCRIGFFSVCFLVSTVTYGDM
jgi:hypothetical protein